MTGLVWWAWAALAIPVVAGVGLVGVVLIGMFVDDVELRRRR